MTKKKRIPKRALPALIVRLTPELKAKIRKHADKLDVSMEHVARAALADYLAVHA